MTAEQVRELVSLVLHGAGERYPYDLIEVLPIVDRDGPNDKFWIWRRNHKLAEGQCYQERIDDDLWQHVWIYPPYCHRHGSLACGYDAWFLNGRFLRLVQLPATMQSRAPVLA